MARPTTPRFTHHKNPADYHFQEGQWHHDEVDVAATGLTGYVGVPAVWRLLRDEIYRPEDDLPSFKQMVSTHGFVDPAVVYFGNISYHSDDVYADQQAYALWCLDAPEGSQLVVGGNHYDVQSGDLVFFDAAIVHAWKQPSKRPTLAILASVPRSPELRKAMGVQKVPYQKLTPQDEERMDYPWNARNVTEPKDGSLPSSWERLAPG